MKRTNEGEREGGEREEGGRERFGELELAGREGRGGKRAEALEVVFGSKFLPSSFDRRKRDKLPFVDIDGRRAEPERRRGGKRTHSSSHSPDSLLLLLLLLDCSLSSPSHQISKSESLLLLLLPSPMVILR